MSEQRVARKVSSDLQEEYMRLLAVIDFWGPGVSSVRTAGEDISLIERIADLASERDTERGLRMAADQENDRLRAERDGLKQQVADSDLAFAHANEVVGKLEADVATHIHDLGHLQDVNNKLMDRVARLSAPVRFTYDEVDEFTWEFGVPEYVRTEDGEAWYWRFNRCKLPVADNLAELFMAARRLVATQRSSG